MTDISWQSGDAYESYVGRWSRRVAKIFVTWLDVPANSRWLDAGCGTGALSAQIPAPALLIGIDKSPAFLSALPRAGVPAAPPPNRVLACAGDAAALPLTDAGFDAVVSGLALNFVPRPESAVAELCRVAAPGATIAAYVWDYANGMAMMRHFWSAAAELDPDLGERDESRSFEFCRDDVLADWWSAAGLHDVTTRRIEIPTVFRDFYEYWTPFLGGQGPAPGYVTARSPAQRDALRESLRSRLPTQPDGSIPLTAAAWAVKGRKAP
ncbi:class I SAM-dependent methyltransferase [Actinoplanes sp. L3-i22]|uniref:class I SAM-dependent methyltransferase n=1 Tax=Actinoplanes sp. L3-i22 TaxID=2836373 RepID=UPI001C762464|nr:class I SAM-dependent methyltransferase [Actinoplanes sp. L3-i22]BCY14133.1 methyltransferase [Actinoplanes sp. L3-i22]